MENIISQIEGCHHHKKKGWLHAYPISCTQKLVNIGFECFNPPRIAPLTKIFTYTIYLYVFITVRTASQLNRLFRTT